MSSVVCDIRNGLGVGIGGDVEKVSTSIDAFFHYLAYDVKVDITSKVAVQEVFSIFHTHLRGDVMNILVPVVYRLRGRLRRGDVAFFASEQFLMSVGKAVDERCREVVSAKRMHPKIASEIGPKLEPVLRCIRGKAEDYRNGKDHGEFERIFSLLTSILTAIGDLD